MNITQRIRASLVPVPLMPVYMLVVIVAVSVTRTAVSQTTEPIDTAANTPVRDTGNVAGTVQTDPADSAGVIDTHNFPVHFNIESASPITKAQLWYTTNRGRSWQLYKDHDGMTSPIWFTAEHEGLHGFYIIVRNKYGWSSSPPAPGTEPQRWYWVDYTAPILQLKSIEPVMSMPESTDDTRSWVVGAPNTPRPPGTTAAPVYAAQGGVGYGQHHAGTEVEQASTIRRLMINWIAHDSGFAQRPISVYYRTDARQSWQRIVEGLPNSGQYIWDMPSRVAERLQIRITATDRVGQVSERISGWIHAPLHTLDTYVGKQQPDPHQPYVGGTTWTPDHVYQQRPGDSTSSYTTDHTQVPGQNQAAPAYNSATRSQATTSDAAYLVQVSGNSGVPGAGTSAASPADDFLTTMPADPRATPRPDVSTLEHAKASYRQATAHRLRGEYDLAETWYARALSADPTYTAAQTDLAACLAEQNKLDKAAEAYSTALSFEPDDVSALQGLAIVQARRKQYRQARVLFERLLRLEPANSQAWLYYGDACWMLNDSYQARQCWNNAIEHSGENRQVATAAENRLNRFVIVPETQ